MQRRVGTRIKVILSAWGIKAHSGCACVSLANKMNNHSPEEIMENLDYWTREMYDSIKSWRSGARKLVPQPPLLTVQKLIIYGCKSA